MKHEFDLTGKKFGKLTALEVVGKDKYNNNIWRCKCDCGNLKDVRAMSLRAGKTQSCGCMSKAGDLTGKRYGNLIVMGRYGTDENGHATWKCKCDCGNEKIYRGTTLRSGEVKTCGCKRKIEIKKSV